MGVMLKNTSRVYLDTNIYLYAFESGSGKHKQAKTLFEEIDTTESTILASEILLTELLVGPFRTANINLVNRYSNIDQHFKHFLWQETTRTIAITAAHIRARYQIKTPDTLHLATAIDQQVDVFYTADKKLEQVQELSIVLI